MRMRIIGLLMAMVLVLVPMASVGAATTADITVNATPAFISISVDPASYPFGTVAVSTNYSTSQGYFNITNGSTVQTDQTISVTAATWAGGVTWTHDDGGTPGSDTVALYASQDTDLFDIIVKFGTPNFIAENQAAATGYLFEIRMMSPTEFTDGVLKTNTVRVSAVAG